MLKRTDVMVEASTTRAKTMTISLQYYMVEREGGAPNGNWEVAEREHTLLP